MCLAPRPPTSSWTTPLTINVPSKPAAAASEAAMTMQASALFMSQAPRPQSRSFTTAPESGG